MTGVRVEVQGLRATAENLLLMSTRIKENVSRVSIRAAGAVLTRAIKGQTYSTFKRETGAVQRGFTAGVARTPRAGGDLRFGSVFQRAQVVSAKTEFGKATSRARFKWYAKRGKDAGKLSAKWWRFLEFGTKSRGRYGSITSRPWVQQSAAAATGAAVEAFRDRMRKGIDDEAAKLSSTRGKP